MAYLLAFLHHVAAFTLVAALAIELVLVNRDVDIGDVRRIALADLAFGISAGVVLLVGLLRVFYFEKGPTYYFHDLAFIAKLSSFVAVGLLSIYPTVTFLSWRRLSMHGTIPADVGARVPVLRRIMKWELIGIVLILLCAALMARGVGHAGP
jgi:putative membrane protein